MSTPDYTGSNFSGNEAVRRAWEVLSMVLLTAGVLLLGFYSRQDDFTVIFTGYALSFAGYALALHLSILQHSWKHYLLLALVLRGVLIFSFPTLSDDVFRFIWDGRLIHEGIHPLRYLPDQLVQHPLMHIRQMQEIYAHLNSPHYYTVYPPVAQLVFYLSTFDFLANTLWMTMVMKIFLFVGELMTAYGLYRVARMFRLPDWTVLLYLLNPLAIVEVMGNLHFEGWMVAFLLWSGIAIAQKRFAWAGVLFACSVGVKLLPLMFLPALFFYFRKGRDRGRFLLGFAICLTLLFIPYIGLLGWDHFIQSLGLYYRKFEFNAGFYYVLRAIGYEMVGYNLIKYIGPAMGILALLLILIVSYQVKRIDSLRRLPAYLLVIYLIFALCSLILHPWYLILPLFLTVFVPNSLVPVWTFLITLTYINYSFYPYHEAMWVVILEYLVVAALIAWEWKTARWIKRI